MKDQEPDRPKIVCSLHEQCTDRGETFKDQEGRLFNSYYSTEIVYGSPEAWLTNKRWRDVLTREWPISNYVNRRLLE